MTSPPKYDEHRPYADPPVNFGDLVGPMAGVVELPRTIEWGPHRRYDVENRIDRNILYERVLREASTTAEVCLYINGSVLTEAWNQLWLPERLRLTWERQFPELAPAA